MDVFDLDERALDQYAKFARSFTKIRSSEIQEKVDRLYQERRFWPEPLIQLNPHYESGGSIQDLVGERGLAPECAQIFSDTRVGPTDADHSLKLRRHQAQAIGLALADKSFVVTTGTGSGKSLCYFVPIVDAVLKAKGAGEGARTRALVIYPMNALANSQQEELRKFLGDSDSSSALTFARYTGQEDNDDRERIKNNPPDILLTNFMMLELLMTRQSQLDKKVVENCAGLRFVVLDELHTYRGRQGADVAMLMRRLRARVGDSDRPPVCIGTSATMVSGDDEDDRNQLVAQVASKLFGTTISRDAVVTETLKRGTDPSRSADRGLADLGVAVDRAANASPYHGLRNAEIANDPLAIWIETRLGLANVDSKPIRARPRSLEDAAKALEEDSSRPLDQARAALKSALLAFSLREKDRGVAGGLDEPLFAFKLHQFISGAGRLYATIDNAGHRTLTFDGQIFDPDHPENRLFATHFCRNCGQEHHPAMLRDADGTPRFEKREIDDVPLNEGDDLDGSSGRWGFLMPEPVDGQFDFQGRDEDYPDVWLEETKSGETRLKATYRKSRAELLSVRSDGSCEPGGRRAWFMPGRFKFCPACREHHSDSTRDINRLASLSAEGRSSATTIIIAAILRWMSGAEADLGAHARKLLAFTDNRQDAALQAGHFNDFIFVTLLRGAILAALQGADDDGLLEDQIGPAVQRVLGFLAANVGRRAEWLVEPELKGANLLTAERGVREALAHRFWIDQRRGWRFTNPNLEQLGLIEARYVSLDEMARDGAAFESAPGALRRATPQEREKAARALFDVMRRGLAVECDALDRLKIEGLAGRLRNLIKVPWSLNEEQFRSATTFMPQTPSRRDLKLRDEDLILRGSRQSAIGRTLRTMKFAGERPSGQEIASIVEGLLQVATKYGLATQVAAPVGGMGWRLIGSAITFHSGSGDAEVGRNNPYFCGMYEEIARLLAEGGAALFGFEGREHTAQVEGELRQIREARFRFSPDDRKTLEKKADQLKEMGEDGRFLPTLFCSPTMELGVDISAMNVVYMRNVPPTPANYAQRSGRAGRSGQAAFIVAYCAAQSPHDQFFFRQPKEMVDGVVRPPSIDLTNPDLVESHLHAEWLAASGVDLDSSIAENLDMTEPGKPLRAEHWTLVSSAESKHAGSERTRAVLEMLAADFSAEPPAWFSDPETHAEKVVDEAPQRFARAFDRWRDLLAAAERQVDDAARTLRDYSISPQERRAAEMRQAAGNTQTKLLLRGSETQGSDFYVYRYLATEGFLPGYNFPRLPLMAFVPGARGGKGERYIQRARFLAISEFGPYSLVYHEGRAYRVDRALLKEAGGGPNGELPTFSAAICPMCGAGHEGEAPEECHVCRHPLAASHIIRQLHRIENVGTREVERITANDEERRRQGFDLQTTFSFAQSRAVTTRALEDLEGKVLTATFAPATLVRRINKGLRRRRSESEIGFWIDPRSGYWAAAGDVGEAEEISPIKARQRITPVVEDRKNALLLRFSEGWRAAAGNDADRVMATIQHALARGVETVYQLEEGEILAEPTPTKKDRRALFFFEAAEGGAGALSRLISEKDGFRSIACAALESMHFAPDTFEEALASGPSALRSVPEARCVAGCYRCLLSYYNQPDHELIDRRNELALQFLLRLAHAEGCEPAEDARPTELPEGCPPPDPEPITVGGVRIDLIWRTARLGAIEEDLASHDLVERLAAKGVELIVLPRTTEARSVALARLAAALGNAP